MLVAVPEASPALVHFSTPSRNIGCIGDRTIPALRHREDDR
jgi:hypothetical protein